VGATSGFTSQSTQQPYGNLVAAWLLSRCCQKSRRRIEMAQKVIKIVGTSNQSFAKAAENAVAEAAKTVRGLKWARVSGLEMQLDGKKIAEYRTTTNIYFDIEQ
jgi:flavin-binding protein dodecin